MSTLRSALHQLAESFADEVLAAIRGTSLDELIAQGGRSKPPTARVGRVAIASGGGGRTPTSGRLHRRSSEEIAAMLEKVVGLVKKNKEGLRAEQLRVELALEAKEMPRILKEGIATKKLKTKGRKRATTYFAT